MREIDNSYPRLRWIRVADFFCATCGFALDRKGIEIFHERGRVCHDGAINPSRKSRFSSIRSIHCFNVPVFSPQSEKLTILPHLSPHPFDSETNRRLLKGEQSPILRIKIKYTKKTVFLKIWKFRYKSKINFIKLSIHNYVEHSNWSLEYQNFLQRFACYSWVSYIIIMIIQQNYFQIYI